MVESEKIDIESFKRDILSVTCEKIAFALKNIPEDYIKKIEEIRLRADKPLVVFFNGYEHFINRNFKLSKDFDNTINISKEDIEKTFQMMCDYSIYAVEDELRQGFITLRGGHRVGITGRAVCDGEKVKTIKHITGMNIRIAHEIKGCSNELIKKLYINGLKHTIITSPPGCGKTTLLRDIIRNLSNGMESLGIRGYKVGLVDERSEIAGCFLGVPQKDVGIRTDVLDACPKAQGMIMLLRSMSPEVIAVDEIGSIEDANAIEDAVNCGVKIIATVHGDSIEEMEKRKGVKKLIENNAIERIVILSRKNGPGTIEKIINL